MRGFNSLSLSNQPLYVVDGVVMDNSTMNETSSGGATIGLASDRPNRFNDYQNRIADINPNDIESITVLTVLQQSRETGLRSMTVRVPRRQLAMLWSLIQRKAPPW